MRGRREDATIRKAKARMLVAAEHYEAGLREVNAVVRSLARHPDFKLSKRRLKAKRPLREALTLIWWLHDCCLSARDDGGDQAGQFLREDATGGAERSLRDFIETDERERGERLRRAA